ncbi:MAG: hypothetical protein IJB34_02365 [Clostridia bacterium]|nr:hypothetical protein [Clostridia bacterium]
MSKSMKTKKSKVRKITEEEYIKYLSSLKGEGQVCAESAQTAVCAQPKEGVATAQKP